MSKFKILLAALLACSLFAVSCGGSEAADTSASDVDASESAETPDDEAMEDDAMEDEEGAMDDDAIEDDAMADEEDAMEDDAMADSGGFPVTIESLGGTFTLESQPQRIVSLSPSATEMLFAIGAGDQVIAVDAFSYFPDAAPVTDLSGWDPNVEAVLAFEPDLVVLSNDANDLVASATAAGVPVLISNAPVDIESGYATFADLGVAVGRVDETADAIATMRAEMDAAFAGAPDASGLRIYHELDDTYFSASSNGFVGSVYAQMGVDNVADAADTEGFGFPQLNEEYLVEADPQLIVITDQVTYTAEDVAARPGWGEISAVSAGNIVVVDADIASRWGPRLPQFVTVVAQALTDVAVSA